MTQSKYRTDSQILFLMNKFKIGDKVKFIESGRRNRTNRNKTAFESLNIPEEFFILEGCVVGFFEPLYFIKDKTKCLVEFNTKKFKNLRNFTTIMIPSKLLTFFKPEGSHPLTDIFCDAAK